MSCCVLERGKLLVNSTGKRVQVCRGEFWNAARRGEHHSGGGGATMTAPTGKGGGAWPYLHPVVFETLQLFFRFHVNYIFCIGFSLLSVMLHTARLALPFGWPQWRLVLDSCRSSAWPQGLSHVRVFALLAPGPQPLARRRQPAECLQHHWQGLQCCSGRHPAVLRVGTGPWCDQQHRDSSHIHAA